MANVKIEFNSPGFREIMLSDGVRAKLLEEAKKIEAEANANNTRGGKGYSTDIEYVKYGGGRLAAKVHANDIEGNIAQSEDQALTKAIKG